jgi:hypothetical protein
MSKYYLGLEASEEFLRIATASKLKAAQLFNLHNLLAGLLPEGPTKNNGSVDHTLSTVKEFTGLEVPLVENIFMDKTNGEAAKVVDGVEEMKEGVEENVRDVAVVEEDVDVMEAAANVAV